MLLHTREQTEKGVHCTSWNLKTSDRWMKTRGHQKVRKLKESMPVRRYSFPKALNESVAQPCLTTFANLVPAYISSRYCVLRQGARCDIIALHTASKAANTKISFLNARVAMQHPGFEFSSAEFNGEAPNARTFMGGYSES